MTSGTLFAFHKLPLNVYIAAIALYSNCAKGMSALQLSRDLNVQYKTAFVLAHKIRESLDTMNLEPIEGEVEIDGAYTNNHVRPMNRKADRKDRRLAENQNPNSRAVVVLRQRGTKGEGANRTLSFITKTENQESTIRIANKHVSKDAVMYADENAAYDVLHAHFDTRRINHSLEYVGPIKENTNQAESYFSRFHRMHMGQHHKMSTLYLDRYANEVAYREDTRRLSNGTIFADITKRCATAKTSRDFCGYWQGNKRVFEENIK